MLLSEKNKKTLLLRLILFLILFGYLTMSQADSSRFFDPETGDLDLSEHLLTHSGFLPVPIIITEPALGFGGGLAAVYFDESIQDKASRNTSDNHFSPPNISLIGAFKTENGSKGALLGGFRSFDNDKYRYTGGLGKVSLNLDYYGPLNNPRQFNIDGLGLMQQLTRRIADSNWMIGGRYVYAKTEIEFPQLFPRFLDPRQKDLDIGRTGLLISYDSRNNILSPSEGIFFESELAAARDWMGSSLNYEDLMARAFAYMSLSDKLILGLRADIKAASDDAPFFFLPYIDLRGIPKARYQGTSTYVAETELEWQVNHRWSVLGFAGIGKAEGTYARQDHSETAGTVGGGFRYLIASKLGLKAGIDIARGPEESAIYIQVGSAWR